MNKLLVTGGNGYIGRHVVKTLENSGFTVDIADRRSGIKGLGDYDAIVHLAGSVWFDGKDAMKYVENNVTTTLDALSYDKPIVFASSASVYGNSVNGESKQICEDLIKKSGVPYTILRIFNPIGGCTTKGVYGRVLSDREVFINNVLSTRDFIHVEDVASAFKAALTSPIDNKTHNIGSGHSVTIKELIEAHNIVNEQNFIADDSNAKHEPDFSDADIASAVEHMKWRPRYNLGEALEKSYKDWKKCQQERKL